MNEPAVIVGIGGAAGDGVASAGNTLALSAARQGQAVYAYHSYQSVIRGGHSWLRVRVSAKKPLTHAGQCGTHIAALCMHYNDFADLVKPTVGTFAKPLLD